MQTRWCLLVIPSFWFVPCRSHSSQMISRINFFCTYAFAVFILSCNFSRHGVQNHKHSKHSAGCQQFTTGASPYLHAVRFIPFRSQCGAATALTPPASTSPPTCACACCRPAEARARGRGPAPSAGAGSCGRSSSATDRVRGSTRWCFKAP